MSEPKRCQYCGEIDCWAWCPKDHIRKLEAVAEAAKELMRSIDEDPWDSGGRIAAETALRARLRASC